MKAFFKVDGMSKLQKDIKKLGAVPQKHVTAAARKGMGTVSKDAKANAPYDTGMLKKGTILAGEKASSKGKKVYRIVFDRKLNDVFQKKNAEGKVVAYYPVSQEYGYFTVNGKYIPGFRFIRDSLGVNAEKMKDTIIDTMKKKIDQEIRKSGLK